MASTGANTDGCADISTRLVDVPAPERPARDQQLRQRVAHGQPQVVLHPDELAVGVDLEEHVLALGVTMKSSAP
jgi:hypothetical protein